MTEHKFTDEEIIKALDCCANGECDECLYCDCSPCKEYLNNAALGLINRQKAEIEEKSKRLREVLPIVAELKAEAVNDFKSALLKKIFPYNTADKKYYAINAYAVERAIIETAELFGGKHENKT